MKKVLLIGILMLAMVCLAPVAVSASSGIVVVSKTGDGTWLGNTWQVQIYPGETKSTTIKLFNSSENYYLVQAFVSPSPQDSGNIVFKVNQPSVYLRDGYYANVSLVVEASGSTTPGVYATEFTIVYEVAAMPSQTVSPLKIYWLSVLNITEDSADVVWHTNRGARSELTFWASPKTVIKYNDYTSEHAVHLDNLADNTIYYFRVVCRDGYGNSESAEGRFTTLKTEIIEPTLPPPTEPEPETAELESMTPEDTLPDDAEFLEEDVEGDISWKWILGGAVIAILVAIGVVYWRMQKKPTNGDK